MKISSKLRSGYYVIAFMVLFCALAGWGGFNAMSTSVDEVKGPVWDTSAGATQSTRGIFEQMLSIEQTISNRNGSVDNNLGEQGELLTRDSIQKLMNAKLVEASAIEAIQLK